MLKTSEILPGLAAVPDHGDGGSDADWRKWILQPGTAGFGSSDHPVGTSAMMRRSLGGASFLCRRLGGDDQLRVLTMMSGVVDGHLKVYDTTNLRVVDASIIPIQLSAHPTSSLYGIAEKAADIIKAAQRG